MIATNLKILIISFYFPPYNKVGGRRWAKHFKYLVQNNIETFVLAGKYSGVSPWDKDIENLKENIFRVENYINEKPFYQKKLPSGFFEKIKWKISYYTWNIKKTKLKGNYNDPSNNNTNNYLNTAKKIIQEKDVNTVVLSVGPFNYSSIFHELKKQFPEIKYIIDYRDYWEDSLGGLSSEQKNFEFNLQQEVISETDLILSPNNEMKNFYASKFKKRSYCLPHCFDETDIIVTNKIEMPSAVISLVYGGAFYAGISENIFLIKQLIDKLSDTKKTVADFYVSIKGYEEELTHHSIKRKDFIDSGKYFEIVGGADYAILILPPNRVNAMSSKFYELIAMRKPVLYFGNDGEVSDFLIKHNLGFHITKENMDVQVKKIISNLTTKSIPDLNYNVKEHTFAIQTQLLIKELAQL